MLVCLGQSGRSMRQRSGRLEVFVHFDIEHFFILSDSALRMNDVQEAPAVIVAGEQHSQRRVQYIDIAGIIENRVLCDLHKLIVFRHLYPPTFYIPMTLPVLRDLEEIASRNDRSNVLSTVETALNPEPGFHRFQAMSPVLDLVVSMDQCYSAIPLASKPREKSREWLSESFYNQWLHRLLFV